MRHNISYTDLQKLSREDKQDFIEEYNIIKEKNKSYIGNIFAELNSFFYFLMFVVIIIPLYKLAFNLDIALSIFKIAINLTKIFIHLLAILILIYIALTLYNSITFEERRKDLFAKYFNFKEEFVKETKEKKFIKVIPKRGRK